MRIRLNDTVEHVRESLSADVQHPVAEDGSEVAPFNTKTSMAGKLALTSAHYRLENDAVYDVANDMGQELVDAALASKAK